MAGNSIETKKGVEREGEWTEWVKAYLSRNPDLKTVPHAPTLLNNYYWRLVDAFLRPLLHFTDNHEHNLHYYKIISASEISIMAVMPFKHKTDDDKELRKQINAEFACYVAYAIIGNWKIDGVNYVDADKLEGVLSATELIDKIKGEEKYYPQSLMDEHIEWLKDLNTAGVLPVLSNAQTWRAIFLASKK